MKVPFLADKRLLSLLFVSMQGGGMEIIMLNDSFTKKYHKIPVAVHTADYTGIHAPRTLLRHNHREFELLIILSGNATFHIGDKDCFAEQGDILLIPPYIPHSADIDENTHFSHRCICFDLSILGDKPLIDELEDGTLSTDFLLKKNTPGVNEMFGYISDIYYACITNSDGREFFLRGSLLILFSILQKEGLILQNENFSQTEFCREMMSFFKQNYHQSITSEDAARYMLMSRGYFCRIFKANFGDCFQNYLCKYRLEQSKKLLNNPKLSITQVSLASGFSGFSYYTKMFRIYNGCTPSEYRKRNGVK